MADELMENLKDMGNPEDLDLNDFSSEDLMAARQELLDMLETGDLTEEQKESLKALLSGNIGALYGGYGGVTGALLALGFASLVFSIICEYLSPIQMMDDRLSEKMAEPQVFNMGTVVNQKIRDSIENMDLLTVLQKMVATTPEDEESEEIREKLRGVLEKYKDMPEEEQTMFANQIKNGLANKIAMKLQDSGAVDGLKDAVREAVVYELYLVGVVAAILILLIVFFGYKLYRSIKDKEKKKEEKKKAKQMKKKK